MNFFDQQERAHKKTKWLTFLFFTAAALMVLTITAMVGGLAYVSENSQRRPGTGVRIDGIGGFWARYGDVMSLAAVGTVAVIAVGSLTKTLALRQGGGKVARDLGGRLLTSEERDFKRRRLLNVVEEMAVASGIPVPEVYLLENEQGINAFAAGFNQGDAAIGVTQGALDKLDREELQGVIAHEFSHIFNGDMRLNMKLMGVLHGILLIGLMGQMLLRSGMYSNMFRGRRDREGGGAALAMMAFGLGVYLVGSIGIFFGHLIKAAVSRQREFLADASAVQFTRNPQGIGGALKKIGGFVRGSQLQAPKTEEVSHLLFGSGMKFWFPGLSTHPPIEERIKAIDPGFDPREFEEMRAAEAAAMAAEGGGGMGAARGATMGLAGGAGGAGLGGSGAGEDTRAAAAAFAAGPEPRRVQVQAQDVMDTVGNASNAHLAHAGTVLAGLPGELRQAVADPRGVAPVVFALLLSTDPGVREDQTANIVRVWGEEVLQSTLAVSTLVRQQDRSRRLALVELALPALKRFPAPVAETFLDTVETLVMADDRVDFVEFALTRVLRTHLSDAYAPRRGEGSMTLDRASKDVHTVFTLVAIAGHASPDAADVALRRGLSVAGLEPRGDTDLSDWVHQVDAALSRLDELSPKAKRRFLEGLLAVITEDGKITADEADLLRAVCQSLHVPLPSPTATGA